VGIFISAGAKTLWASETVLAPSETREVSINQLQSERIPDDYGRRIPITAKEGVADWRTPDSGQLTGRLMVTSHDRAMARNFSCGTYYGVCYLSFYTYYTDIAVGGVLPMYGASADYCNFNPNAPNRCVSGTPISGTVNYYWSVGAASIIALNTIPQLAKPTLKGVSTGGGYANVQAQAGQCTASGGGTPTVTVPIPVNFSAPTVTKLPDGTLYYNSYTFQSNSGRLADLSNCQVGETVFYPGSQATYTWPYPMVNTQATPNPTVILGPATGGGFSDSNKPPDSYTKPYSNASFPATQTLEWECSNYQDGAFQRFVPNITITRSVGQNASGVWQYTITKGTDTNTINLP
jgi:hypothetical protein